MTLLVHAAATWALVGLIWVVQVVIYPIYAHVPERGFRAFHAFYTQRIGLVVGILMGVEGISGLLLFADADLKASLGAGLWPATALLLFNWLVTGALFLPLHNRLAGGFEAGAHRRLVGLNWLRTAAWSLRGVLVVFWLVPGAA